MTITTTLSERMPRWKVTAIIVGVLAFVFTVVSLHLLQTGYDPAHQLMSELAFGSYGWAMAAAFGGLALAVLGVQSAISTFGASQELQILLVLAALCFVLAGVFPLGDTLNIHITTIALAFVFSVFAMYLFPSRAGHATVAAPRAISWTLAGGMILSIALGHSFLPMGVGQRLAALFMVAWLTVLAWNLSRLR